MIYLAWILTVLGAFWLGYRFNRLIARVEVIESEVKKKIEKPPEEPESFIVDELDEVQKAQYEHEKMMEKLNGR